MKTEAGWPRGCALMNCSYWDNKAMACTSEGPCIYNDQGCEESAMVADGCRSQVKALEADNARMREALEESGRYVCKTTCESFTAAGGECCGLHKRIIAALTGSPSGAFVTLEQLRELADGFHGTDGLEIGLCPVCAAKESHTADCWLAAKIKEAEDA